MGLSTPSGGEPATRKWVPPKGFPYLLSAS